MQKPWVSWENRESWQDCLYSIAYSIPLLIYRAGLVKTSMMHHPLDIIKIRWLNWCPASLEHSPVPGLLSCPDSRFSVDLTTPLTTSLWDCVKKVTRTEGLGSQLRVSWDIQRRCKYPEIYKEDASILKYTKKMQVSWCFCIQKYYRERVIS